METAEKSWVWIGNELFDSQGFVLARVASDVIALGDERILVESATSMLNFRCRATSSAGEISVIELKRNFALEAHCGDRYYRLPRLSPWRKERAIIGHSGTAAFVRPMISGKVRVLGAQHCDDLPLVDAVVLSWACVLVDCPVRRPKG